MSRSRVSERARRAAVARASQQRLVVAVLMAVVFGALGCVDARAGDLRGKVTRVRDGDTIEIRRGGETIRVRVSGIDCPERGQPWSAKAKQATADLVGNREVVVRVHDHDVYGRTVGEVLLPDGRNLGEELVRQGLAWHYRHYSNDPTLARLEAEARAAHRGLWIDPHPTPPWEYRHHGGGATPATS
ncbi:MAG TPA: thermonuclease family protein [Candidatus Binatia bacterium]|nr:thermonuclease family protein [Candidatus Binatia bacterium]